MRGLRRALCAGLLILTGNAEAADVAATYSALHLSGETVSGVGAAASWPVGQAFRIGLSGSWQSGSLAGEDLSEWGVFGGPSWTPRRAHTLSPFLEAGVGLVRSRRQLEVFGVALGPDGVCEGGCPSDTAFAAELGGGLDVRLSGHFALRVFEVDYRYTTLADDASRLRFAAGLVWRAGR